MTTMFILFQIAPWNMILFTMAMTWQIPTEKGFLLQKPVGLTVKVTMMLLSSVGLLEDIAFVRAQVPGEHIGSFTKLLEMFPVLQEAVVVQVSILA